MEEGLLVSFLGLWPFHPSSGQFSADTLDTRNNEQVLEVFKLNFSLCL